MAKKLTITTLILTPILFFCMVFGFVLLFAGPAPAADCAAGASSTEPVKDGTVPNGWGPLVERAAAESGVPSSVLAAQIEAESGWNPKAVSPVGAQGLTQFMPGTWARYGQGDPFDPVAAITAQGAYMKSLLALVQPLSSTSSQPAVSLALAAYNAGEGAVFQFGGIPPYLETQNYVAKILSMATKYVSGGTSLGQTVTPASSCTGLGTSNVGVSNAGDNYPFKDGPYNATNPVTGFAYRNCTDFAWIRMMEQKGITDQSRWNATKVGAGNGADWRAAWQRWGWPISQKPVVGAITWYAAFQGQTSQYGHVAIVKEILPDGRIVEEGYNFGNPPDGTYYTRTLPADYPTAYLYIPEGPLP